MVKYFLVQSAGSSLAVDLEEIYFDFRKQCFVYSKEKGTFCKLSYPTKETFGYYVKSSGHGSEAKVFAATEKWGRNVWVPFSSIIIFSTCIYFPSVHNYNVFVVESLCLYNIYELDMF
jgi:hypothetical protein